jgi:hypothetical protein
VVTLCSLCELTLTGCNKLHFVSYDWQNHHSLNFSQYSSGVGSLKRHYASTIHDTVPSTRIYLPASLRLCSKHNKAMDFCANTTVLSTERPIMKSTFLRGLPPHWPISLSLARPTADELARLGVCSTARNGSYQPTCSAMSVQNSRLRRCTGETHSFEF